VFRFLELEWKPITFEQSLIEYMLRKTVKEEGVPSIDDIMKPLLELTEDKLVKSNLFNHHNKNQSPKHVLPYTYYKKG
jgi:hypothetical protein